MVNIFNLIIILRPMTINKRHINMLNAIIIVVVIIIPILPGVS